MRSDDWQGRKGIKVKPARRVGQRGLRHCSYCLSKACRRSRPLCRAMRLVKPTMRPCYCSNGAWPGHRTGGHKLCEHHPNHALNMWEELGREIRRAG